MSIGKTLLLFVAFVLCPLWFAHENFAFGSSLTEISTEKHYHPGPYFVWRDSQGDMQRGPNFKLKDRDALVQVFDAVRRKHNISNFVRRANSDQESVRMWARENLDQIRTSTGIPGSNALNLAGQIYYDLLAKFGNNDDVKWLMDVAYEQDTIYAAKAAVNIELRLGRLENGYVLSAAKKRLENGRLGGWYSPISALIISGVPDAVAMGDTLRTQLIEEGNYYSAGQFGLYEKLLVVGAGHEEEALEYLDTLKHLVEEGVKDPSSFNFPYLPEFERAYVGAVLYLAKFAPEIYLDAATMPIPVYRKEWPAGFIGETKYASLISSDPVQLLDLRFSKLTGPNSPLQFSTQFWVETMAGAICNIVRPLPDNERAQAYERVAERMAAYNRLSYPDYSSRSQTDQKGIDLAVKLASDVAASECLMSESVVGSDLAAFMNDGVFDYVAHRPLQKWWTRPKTIATYIETARSLEDLEWLSPYSSKTVENAIVMTNLEPVLAEAILKHHETTTAAFRPEMELLDYGNEIRRFRIQELSPTKSTTLVVAGHVNMKPIVDGKKLVIAFQHRILAGDHGGLAAAMSADDRKEYDQSGRKKMFEFVRLEQNGKSVDAKLVQEIGDNVLVYEAPYDGDPSDSYIRVGMRYVDLKWNFDYALFEASNLRN